MLSACRYRGNSKYSFSITAEIPRYYGDRYHSSLLETCHNMNAVQWTSNALRLVVLEYRSIESGEEIISNICVMLYIVTHAV